MLQICQTHTYKRLYESPPQPDTANTLCGLRTRYGDTDRAEEFVNVIQIVDDIRHYVFGDNKLDTVVRNNGDSGCKTKNADVRHFHVAQFADQRNRAKHEMNNGYYEAVRVLQFRNCSFT